MKKNRKQSKMADKLDELSAEFFDKKLSDDLKSLKFKHFFQLLSRDDLTVDTEWDVCEAILAWIDHKAWRRRFDLPVLLTRVRLTLVAPEDLYCLLANRWVREDQISKEIIKGAINSAAKQEPRKGQLQPIPTVELSEEPHQEPHHESVESHQEPKPRPSRTQIISAYLLAGEPGRVRKEYLLAIGGTDGKKRLNSVLIYDPELELWTDFMELPVGMSATAAVHHKESREVYLFGGFSEMGHLLDEIWELDYLMKTCEQVATLPEPMSGICAGVVGDQIYLAGGWDGTYQKHCYRFDIKTKSLEPITSMSSSMCYSNLLSIESSGTLLAIDTSNTPAAECFCIEKNFWLPVSFVRNPPSSRFRARPLKVSDQVFYLIGGSCSQTVDALTLVGDNPAQLLCKSLPLLNVPRNCPSAALLSSRRGPHPMILVAGGEGKSSVEVFDTNVKYPKWRLLKDELPENRAYFDLVQFTL